MSIFKIKESLEETANKVIDLINANLDYYKIVAFDTLILLLLKSVSAVIAGLAAFLVVFFGSFAFAYFIGEILGHLFWGFLIIAGLYGIMGGIIWVNRVKWIINPIISTLAEVIEETSNELDMDEQDSDEE